MEFLGSPSRIARSVQVSRYLSGFRGLYWSLEHVWSVNSLIHASEAGLTDIACELIDRGHANIDYASSIGGTALIAAAASNRLGTLRALLQRGADPYKANWYGNALHCAAEANCLATLQELLTIGVKPDTLSPTGRTALSCTIDRENVEAADLLLQHGASLHYTWPQEMCTCGDPNEPSFFEEIEVNHSVSMLRMLVFRGHVDAQDRGLVVRIIESTVGKGMGLDQARQLIERLDSVIEGGAIPAQIHCPM